MLGCGHEKSQNNSKRVWQTWRADRRKDTRQTALARATSGDSTQGGREKMVAEGKREVSLTARYVHPSLYVVMSLISVLTECLHYVRLRLLNFGLSLFPKVSAARQTYQRPDTH
jgi:hypothetical protein